MNGIPLPRIGTFEFNIIVEGVRRERSEKVAFAQFIAGFLGPMSGMEAKQASLLVADYAEEVFQFKYNYKYESMRMRVVEEKLAAQSEDMRILQKVAAMTVTEKPKNA